MPIDPLMALRTQAPDIGQAIGSGLQNAGSLMALRENKQMAPLRAQQALSEMDLSKINSYGMASATMLPMLEKGDTQGVKNYLTRRKAQLDELGLDSADTAEAIGLVDTNPELLKQRSLQAVQVWQQFNPRAAKSAALQEFEAKTKGLSPEDVERARRIDLGLDPRAIGSSAITIAETGKTNQVATSQATIEGAKAGAKESAKLDVQLEKLPGVKAAVTAAQERIKNEVDIESVAKKNAIALDMYNNAIKGLSESLQNTATGPGIGKAPALTAEQQIAEGAVAAMAPVLKAIFRTSGEGTFTDKDQELLLGMVPTRNDHPEARVAKIANIDAIIRAKLGMAQQSPVQGQQQTTQPQSLQVGKYKVTVK